MAGPDLSVVVNAADLSTIAPALLATMGVMMGVYMMIKGIKMFMGAVKGETGGFSQADWDLMDDDDKGFYGVSDLNDLNSRYSKY